MKIKEPKMNKQNTFVRGYHIDKKICDDLIELFNLNKHLAVEGVSVNTSGAHVDSEIKKCIEMFVKPDFEDINPYLKALGDCVKKYVDEFKTLNKTNKLWTIRSNLKMQKYTAPGDGYYRWHCERDGDAGSVSRLLVFMTYLNTVQKGGHTEFLYQKLKVKPEKGLTLIWPADFTHIHRGNKVEKDDKYIITGWFEYLND